MDDRYMWGLQLDLDPPLPNTESGNDTHHSFYISLRLRATKGEKEGRARLIKGIPSFGMMMNSDGGGSGGGGEISTPPPNPPSLLCICKNTERAS